jgi:two-component system, NtrC family, nitrogen regulation response regulator NtrX
MPSVLIVDDEANIRRMVGALLAAEGYDVHDAPDAFAGLALAEAQDPDLALVDLMMPGDIDGLGLLERLRQRRPDTPVIMMSGRAALTDAVRATRLGAFTFLEKPLTPESVLLAIASALELRQARRTARALREDLGLSAEMVGDSPAMQTVKRLIAQVGPTDARVLVTGESGTGKELVAAALHAASPRRELPFIRVNCAAIPRDLLESEMFGHEKGAFTGATERRIGRFELAHTGTLFLDEVGDLGLEAQAKLLRAIEAREIERVGGGKPIRVDVRIIAATNKNLARAVRDGLFREDLFFRLNVIPIELPPLRDRASDLPQLVQHFAERHRVRTGQSCACWTEDVMDVFRRYSWPGNVRELANIVERLSILHAGGTVTATQVRRLFPDSGTPPSAVRAVAAPGDDAAGVNASGDLGTAGMSLTEALDAFERQLIGDALAAADGSVAEAARRLQTDRPNLYRRMRRLGVGGSPDDA